MNFYPCLKLQGVKNCLARVVTKSPRFCHITPLLKSLHWLPVRYMIKFMLCSLTYQALPNGQPVYIRNMLQPLRKVRTLRSGDLDQLKVHGSQPWNAAEPFLLLHLDFAKNILSKFALRKHKLVSGRNWKHIFLVRLFRLKSLVVRSAQTTNANVFWNYESDYEYVCHASGLGSPRI